METAFDLPERGERQVRERRKASRQVAQETIDVLVSRYLDGVPTLALAKQFKLGKETVSKLLREAGVEIRRQGLPEDKVAEAAVLYRSGLTLAEVAEHYGVSAHAVYNKLRAAGVQMRAGHGGRR
jgi:transposase